MRGIVLSYGDVAYPDGTSAVAYRGRHFPKVWLRWSSRQPTWGWRKLSADERVVVDFFLRDGTLDAQGAQVWLRRPCRYLNGRHPRRVLLTDGLEPVIDAADKTLVGMLCHGHGTFWEAR